MRFLLCAKNHIQRLTQCLFKRCGTVQPERTHSVWSDKDERAWNSLRKWARETFAYLPETGFNELDDLDETSDEESCDCNDISQIPADTDLNTESFDATQHSEPSDGYEIFDQIDYNPNLLKQYLRYDF